MAKAPPVELGVCSLETMNEALDSLTRKQALALAQMSGVVFATIYKRKKGRDIMLSKAHALSLHLSAVRTLDLRPRKEEYHAFIRARTAAAIKAAQRP